MTSRTQAASSPDLAASVVLPARWWNSTARSEAFTAVPYAIFSAVERALALAHQQRSVGTSEHHAPTGDRLAPRLGARFLQRGDPRTVPVVDLHGVLAGARRCDQQMFLEGDGHPAARAGQHAATGDGAVLQLFAVEQQACRPRRRRPL